ncbi:hypothetical protein JYT48_02620 [Mariprofundus ferrooxydans]|nr:hypothetical protein [Mariprofundus ferrooxydans]
MDIKEAVAAVMREYLVPELEALKAGQLRADVEFAAINKRLDDVNQHLVDQSRRIDSVREELGQRIDKTNERIDVMSSGFNRRIDATDASLGRLYEVIVRREEHSAVVIKLNTLEQDVRELQHRLAAQA